MRNFVAKNDYNRASSHKDLKNDYDRKSKNSQIEEELCQHYIEKDHKDAISFNDDCE